MVIPRSRVLEIQKKADWVPVEDPMFWGDQIPANSHETARHDEIGAILYSLLRGISFSYRAGGIEDEQEFLLVRRKEVPGFW